MIRRILALVLITVFFSSCGNNRKKEVSDKTEGSENAIKVEFAALAENPDNYLNKNIIVEGKVVHVCTMSGKKLFIVGENPDVRLFISAGEDMPKFPMELLGSEIIVEGKITRAAGASLEKEKDNGEKMNSESEGIHAMKNEMQVDSCETETALASQVSLTNIVMEYKSHTVK